MLFKSLLFISYISGGLLVLKFGPKGDIVLGVFWLSIVLVTVFATAYLRMGVAAIVGAALIPAIGAFTVFPSALFFYTSLPSAGVSALGYFLVEIVRHF